MLYATKILLANILVDVALHNCLKILIFGELGIPKNSQRVRTEKEIRTQK